MCTSGAVTLYKKRRNQIRGAATQSKRNGLENMFMRQFKWEIEFQFPDSKGTKNLSLFCINKLVEFHLIYSPPNLLFVTQHCADSLTTAMYIDANCFIWRFSVNWLQKSQIWHWALRIIVCLINPNRRIFRKTSLSSTKHREQISWVSRRCELMVLTADSVRTLR